jgi:hypothetical protein
MDASEPFENSGISACGQLPLRWLAGCGWMLLQPCAQTRQPRWHATTLTRTTPQARPISAHYPLPDDTSLLLLEAAVFVEA